MRISAMDVSSLRVCRVIIIFLSLILLAIVYITGRNDQMIGTLVIAQDEAQGRRAFHQAPSAPGNATSPSSSLDQTIHAVERYCLDFDVGGFMFNENGRYKELHKLITSCLVHSFSPYIEQQAALRFLDPARDNIYFANSPALLFYHNKLELVSRVWLDREKYEPRNDWPANHFADNWLYRQTFDSHMRPLTSGSIIGIPSPKQWWVGDGPIEPRLFKCKDRLFVMFNAAMAFAQQYYMDYSIMWDLNENIPIIPKIEGGTPMINATEANDMPRDKHWMALIDNDELYFVHNLDPLRVLHCTLNGYCKFVHNEKSASGFVFNDQISHLRGGTPFELYEYPYYISVAHTTMYKKTNGHRYYASHIVVLSVKPYRVVYVSNDIKIHKKLYKSAPMVRARYIDDGFIFPVGIIIENRDVISIGVHINDFSSVIIRLKGLETLMTRVINSDKREAPRRGPPIKYLQKHIHDILVNETKIPMVHS